jgi:hypothetical protein
MNRKRLTVCLFTLLSISPAIALSMDLPAPEIIVQHAGLFQWLIGLALVGQGFWISRYIRQNDSAHDALKKENDKQWEAMAEQSRALIKMVEQFSELRGEHNSIIRASSRDNHG